MAVSVAELTSGAIVADGDVDKAGESDVRGGPTTLHMLHVGNIGGSAAACYLKLYDSLAPTFGTTEPEFVFLIPATEEVPIVFPGGFAFANGLSWCAATEAGKGATTDPTDTVTLAAQTT